MTPPQPYTAKLEDRIDHNGKYIELHFELQSPHNLVFQAGQYVSIQVTEQGHRRSYSICSTPDITHGFELLVDVEPQGVGTQYLQRLQVGETISLLAPMGMFTVAEATSEEQLIFIATGSGITPFKSMIEDQLRNKQDQRTMTLYWGMRHVDQLFWLEYFQELMDAFPQFHFHPVISKPIPEWPLCRGRVTDCLRNHEFSDKAGFYLCGNAPMIQEVQVLLQEKQVLPAQIHHEKFF